MRRWGILALAGLLGGCVVGPNYRGAKPPAATQQPFVQPTLAGPAAVPDKWWTLYADPTLDYLIDLALRNNTDVRVAAANLRRARFVLAETRAGRLPTTDLSGSFTHTRTGSESFGTSTAATSTTGGTGVGLGTGTDTGTGTGTGSGVGTGAGSGVGTGTGTSTSTSTVLPNGITTDFWKLGLDVNYELDLFGGVTRSIQAARGDFEAAAEALNNTRITVAADTTRAYGEACGYAEQAATAAETARLQARTVDLTQRLFEGGRGTRRDVSQARTLYEQALADIPTYQGEQRASLIALAVLTGRAPALLEPIIARCARPPQLTQLLPVGDGAELLRRRPDVRQAERKLAADTARIGVAVADLYPSITLLGSVSLGATRAGDLGKSKSFNYSIGPLISWSFPIQSAARARVHQAEAQADASLATFDGTVLLAIRETEQALARLDAANTRNAALRRAQAAAADAAQLSRERFDFGADTFLDLLDAERTRAAASAQLAASDSAVLDAQVDLFRALGGGWIQAPPVMEKTARHPDDAARVIPVKP